MQHYACTRYLFTCFALLRFSMQSVYANSLRCIADQSANEMHCLSNCQPMLEHDLCCNMLHFKLRSVMTCRAAGLLLSMLQLWWLSISLLLCWRRPAWRTLKPRARSAKLPAQFVILCCCFPRPCSGDVTMQLMHAV